jgi:threonine/homoserine/homoserine lactone efflux protein
MEAAFFIKGLIVGFSIAAPVGPIGLLCVRRTFAKGRVYGFYSGLGAATADAIYGCIAAFGLTFISNFLISQQWWLSIVGGSFLCWLGIRTFLSNQSPTPMTADSSGNGLIGAYISTFVLTMTNPLTILAYAMIFAGLGLAGAGENYFSAGIMVMGVFLGSALWWLLLCVGIGFFRIRINPNWLMIINKVSGVILAIFGLLVFWEMGR